MDDVERAILSAWTDVRDRLDRNAGELRRRLARRSSALMQQHPRAWCLAIRATDTRLEGLASIPPSHRPSFPLHRSNVFLTARVLRRLCAPVQLDAPGEPLADVARRLGTTPRGLLDARLRHVFDTHHVAGLGARHGRPRPLLYAGQPLDPASRLFLPPDPVWSHTARSLISRIPDRFEQTLTRVPHHHRPRARPRTSAEDLDTLHPEHPDVDAPPPRPRDQRLPPPRPDYVWYKWRGDEYVAHDWRHPASSARHHAREDRLRLARAATKRRRDANNYRKTDPPPRAGCESGHGPEYRGWRWLCPRCGRKVNLLYLPLPRPLLLLDAAGRSAVRGQRSAKPRPTTHHPQPTTPGFACKQCHKVKSLSRCDYKGWNELITYLTGGLLYGHEVPRPSWYRPLRKNAYAPRVNAPPSRRRAQIERLLLKGCTIKEAALVLGLSFGTVLWYAQRIYPQHGVSCLKELLIKYKIPPRPHMRGKALGKRGEGRVRHRKRRRQAALTAPSTRLPAS